jgi:hypothetical protein
MHCRFNHRGTVISVAKSGCNDMKNQKNKRDEKQRQQKWRVEIVSQCLDCYRRINKPITEVENSESGKCQRVPAILYQKKRKRTGNHS